MKISKIHSKISKNKETPLYFKMPILTVSSWLFQGILFMDVTEKIFKILVEILFFIPFYLIFSYYNIWGSIILALICSHTLNWIFNGQIFVMLKNLELVNTEKKSFDNCLRQITKKAEYENSIRIVAVSGSISDKGLKKTSDLDVRIIRNKGILNGFKSCSFVLRARSQAFFNKFPLDIYVFDSYEKLGVADKNPIIMLDKRTKSKDDEVIN